MVVMGFWKGVDWRTKETKRIASNILEPLGTKGLFREMDIRKGT